ncbi:MAG: exo-alpha-sialidase [Candidatus Binataceae bacterium]|nr:exo-alpha-sialidase [Candidatus Binataceae bacterium]
MKLCVGTSKGIVILDPARGGTPVMVLAEPSAIWCIAQDAEDRAVIYAGANGFMTSGRGRGVLARSRDGGRSWTDITPSLGTDEDVWALGAPPDRPGEIFVGTSHARLFRSSDRGLKFRECLAFQKVPGRDRWTFPPPPHIPHVRSISFDPNQSSTMYVGVEEGGVFRSRDLGDSFEALNKGIYTDIHTIAVDPANSRRLYATTGDGFYLSEDAGAAWRHITDGLTRSYTVPLLVRHGSAASVYTAAAAGPPPGWSRPAGADARFFRSDDNGWSFQPIGSGGEGTRGMVMRLREDPEAGDGFFGVLNEGTVIRSEAGRDRIAAIASGLPPAYDLAIIP